MPEIIRAVPRELVAEARQALRQLNARRRPQEERVEPEDPHLVAAPAEEVAAAQRLRDRLVAGLREQRQEDLRAAPELAALSAAFLNPSSFGDGLVEASNVKPDDLKTRLHIAQTKNVQLQRDIRNLQDKLAAMAYEQVNISTLVPAINKSLRRYGSKHRLRLKRMHTQKDLATGIAEILWYSCNNDVEVVD